MDISGAVYWSSDRSIEGTGWEICKHVVNVPQAPCPGFDFMQEVSGAYGTSCGNVLQPDCTWASCSRQDADLVYGQATGVKFLNAGENYTHALPIWANPQPIWKLSNATTDQFTRPSHVKQPGKGNFVQCHRTHTEPLEQIHSRSFYDAADDQTGRAPSWTLEILQDIEITSVEHWNIPSSYNDRLVIDKEQYGSGGQPPRNGTKILDSFEWRPDPTEISKRRAAYPDDTFDTGESCTNGNDCYGWEVCGRAADVFARQVDVDGQAFPGRADRRPGILQLRTSREWFAVCDDSFGYSEAIVACRELGYESAVWPTTEMDKLAFRYLPAPSAAPPSAAPPLNEPAATGKRMLQSSTGSEKYAVSASVIRYNITCKGTEQKLSECRSEKWLGKDSEALGACSSPEAVILMCNGVAWSANLGSQLCDSSACMIRGLSGDPNCCVLNEADAACKPGYTMFLGGTASTVFLPKSGQYVACHFAHGGTCCMQNPPFWPHDPIRLSGVATCLRADGKECRQAQEAFRVVLLADDTEPQTVLSALRAGLGANSVAKRVNMELVYIKFDTASMDIQAFEQEVGAFIDNGTLTPALSKMLGVRPSKTPHLIILGFLASQAATNIGWRSRYASEDAEFLAQQGYQKPPTRPVIDIATNSLVTDAARLAVDEAIGIEAVLKMVRGWNVDSAVLWTCGLAGWQREAFVSSAQTYRVNLTIYTIPAKSWTSPYSLQGAQEAIDELESEGAFEGTKRRRPGAIITYTGGNSSGWCPFQDTIYHLEKIGALGPGMNTVERPGPLFVVLGDPQEAFPAVQWQALRSEWYEGTKATAFEGAFFVKWQTPAAMDVASQATATWNQNLKKGIRPAAWSNSVFKEADDHVPLPTTEDFLRARTDMSVDSSRRNTLKSAYLNVDAALLAAHAAAYAKEAGSSPTDADWLTKLDEGISNADFEGWTGRVKLRADKQRKAFMTITQLQREASCVNNKAPFYNEGY
eukprot:TRINITY_DN28376_c0_g1_i1.p1 TRINITY_DN28376_c0_g1~~TRINITY_DN28376_c0_g1_i1.p1  ORF type:complete len:981 (+),score=146.96 TRINITY_DN28376_c0_g1_i1:176-3118(+)